MGGGRWEVGPQKSDVEAAKEQGEGAPCSVAGHRQGRGQGQEQGQSVAKRERSGNMPARTNPAVPLPSCGSGLALQHGGDPPKFSSLAIDSTPSS